MHTIGFLSTQLKGIGFSMKYYLSPILDYALGFLLATIGIQVLSGILLDWVGG